MPLSEERRNNPVYGEKQAPPAIEVAADGQRATFTWDRVRSELGGEHEIRVTVQVTLSERQAEWAVSIANHSPYTVENVYCPYLGDVQHPAGRGMVQDLPL